jgi:hypothetical protein
VILRGLAALLHHAHTMRVTGQSRVPSSSLHPSESIGPGVSLVSNPGKLPLPSPDFCPSAYLVPVAALPCAPPLPLLSVSVHNLCIMCVPAPPSSPPSLPPPCSATAWMCWCWRLVSEWVGVCTPTRARGSVHLLTWGPPC